MRNSIKQIAIDAGATAVGIASAAPLTNEVPRLLEYISAGLPSGMDYIARPARLHADIREWFPGARSALVCVFGYGGLLPRLKLDLPPYELAADMRKRGQELDSHFLKYPTVKVAAFYALDYHKTVKTALKTMLERVKEKYPGIEGKVFCDTSPVLEKALAVNAGLGWIGKNTLFFTQECGSWLILGGLALSAELEPDTPGDFAGCGCCWVCVSTCPSKALSDYRLNPARCASYWNIPRKTPLTPNAAALCGDRAYGCDICQQSCPQNAKAQFPCSPLFCGKNYCI